MSLTPEPTDPSGMPDPANGWSAGPVSQPPAWQPPPPPGRGSLIAALFLVAVLAGSALFAAGFTLGLQQSLAPGSGGDERALFEPFWETYRTISTEYVGQYDPRELVEGAIQGMFGALDDPYSSYMTSDEYRQSLDSIGGSFEGIGATMQSLDDSGGVCTTLGEACHLVVVGIIDGSPAEAAGLEANDRLVAVDDEDVTGSTVDRVVERVRGPRGTTVRLSIVRDGSPMELTITRDVIQRPAVQAELLADGSVGYLRIDGFSGGSADELRARLQEQLDAGAGAFILDLRDDPGGFVEAALSIASQFVGSGPIYWDQYADGRTIPHEALPDGLATDPTLPMVVLVNGGTASASEIVAGALQDADRATLVGETTFGKGTVQQWHLLSGDAGGFRLSVARWLTPDQTWIHGVGITPDEVVAPSGVDDIDPQLERALAILEAAIRGDVPSTSAAPSPSPAGSTVPAGASPAPGSGSPEGSVGPGGGSPDASILP